MGLWNRLFTAGCFIRGSALGGTLLIAALGALAGNPRPALPAFAAVLGVAFLFHVFAYVSNDVVDLPLDRVARPISPLVRGWVSPATAVFVALAQVPLALLLAVAVGGPGAGALLAMAFVTMAIYNVYGKRCPFPPLTDAVQGVAWAGLLLCGAAMAGTTSNRLVWTMAAFTVAFILMANGIHGSLRDLVNDREFGVRSTAIVLGARPQGIGRIWLPRPLVAYAAGLHVLAFAILWSSVARNDASYSTTGRLVVCLLLAVLTLASTRFMIVALRSGDDIQVLRAAGMVHLVTLLAVPMTLLVPLLDSRVLLALVLMYLLPLVPHSGLPDALRWSRQRARATFTRSSKAGRSASGAGSLP